MKALVFGAGKIARGFIGQLLYRSGCEIVFAECNDAYAQTLDRAGRYYVNVMGKAEESEWIEGYRCYGFADMEKIAEALWDADVIFTSVIGKNLESLGGTIAQAFRMRPYTSETRKRTIITCENWKNPSGILRGAILDKLSREEGETFKAVFGVTEAVVMRSAVEATPEVLAIDALAVSVHNFWRLPVNAAGCNGPRPEICGVEYMDQFEGFLQQKVYTYNGTNASIAYLGALRGHKLLSEAANDPEILRMLEGNHSEINRAICAELNVSMEKQVEFAQSALTKYQDRSIVDFVERHARDPLRKLGPEDRIVGVARMIQRQGIEPIHEARTLAAALYYTSENESDPSASQLCSMRREEGVDAVLQKICKISPTEKLAVYVHEQIDELRELGWIDET